MKSIRQIFLVLTVLSCLSALGWAAPRVAIVTPLSGDVCLDGAKLFGPRLAEEGQQLTVADDGSARIQLLGSAKEKVLKGRAAYTISKANLELDGKVVARGSVAVADEIGSINKAAALSARDVLTGSVDINGDYLPVGFTLVFPPARTDWGWRIAVATPVDEQLKLTPNSPIEAIVCDLDEDPDKVKYDLTINQPTPSLDFEDENGPLVVGHRYKICLKNKKSNYTRRFQVLMPQEQQALDEMGQALKQEASETGKLADLLKVVNFYLSVDQPDQVAEALLQVVAHPDYQSLSDYPSLKGTSKDDIVQLLNASLRSLDRGPYKV